MKHAFFIIAIVLTSTVKAQPSSQNCFNITNNIDRKYCIDKYLESVKNKLAAEKKTWSAGLASKVKDTRTEALNSEILAKKDQKAMVEAEISMTEKHLADLNSVAVAAPKKKDKKKDKKKLPFGIKL